MTQASPFSLKRYEYEPTHLYFLPEDSLRAQLEGPKPVYLVGARGTGKTSLLRALTWSERTDNASLAPQLGTAPLQTADGLCFGTYLKLPEIQLGLIEAWTRPEDDELAASEVFSIYFELLWLQQIAEELTSAIAAGVVEVGAMAEQATVARIVKKWPRTFGNSSRMRTLAGLAESIAGIRYSLEAKARIKEDISTFRAQADILGAPGMFGAKVAEMLSEMCDGDRTRRWYFKMCMDEGECLSAFQLRVLNTMVRVAKWPVFPIVAFVGMPKEVTRTTYPALSVQQADLDIIDLNAEFRDSRSGRFREFATGVAALRISAQLGREYTLDLDRVLGKLSINELLSDILSESVSPRAKQLLTEAKRLGSLPYFQRTGEGRGDPIYEAYLIEQLNLRMPEPNAPLWERRAQSSAELRKRMVAAYLSICDELGAQVMYASSDMVLSLSDGCVRDFLNWMNEIFVEVGREIAAFLERRITNKTQSQAIVRAAIAKSQTVLKAPVSAPSETQGVVRGLARITAQLQRRSNDGQHLRSSERGVFELRRDLRAAEKARIEPLIREAAEAGFLSSVADDDQALRFRVHASLAPAFGFSYRGAYYPTTLEWRDLDALALCQSEKDIEDVAYRIGIRVAGEENFSLFDQL